MVWASVEHGTLQSGQRLFIANSGDYFWAGFSAADNHLAVTPQHKHHVSSDCSFVSLGAACVYALACLQALVDGNGFLEFFI
jgi:hypothetical protein